MGKTRKDKRKYEEKKDPSKKIVKKTRKMKNVPEEYDDPYMYLTDLD